MLLLLFANSCHQQKNEKKQLTTVNDNLSIQLKKNLEGNNCKSETVIDTNSTEEIPFVLEEGDTSHIEKKRYNELKRLFDNYKLDDYPVPPAEAYNLLKYLGLCNDKGVNFKDEFHSECEKDYFFICYAWFLKQYNGSTRFEKERKPLYSIFQLLNNFTSRLVNGGTHFGHQADRIHAYVEYAISQIRNGDYDFTQGYCSNINYNIKNQKKHFLNYLRQLAVDVTKVDNECWGQKHKKSKLKTIYSILERLDKEINNRFLFYKATEFYFTNYPNTALWF